jgi:hypothetical protein
MRIAAILLSLVLAGARPAAGQNVTSGTITGLVRDQQGGVLPGATVTAVHGPTGTTYEGVTQGDGRFSLLNVRVGGPYVVEVALAGFRSETVQPVTVTLGISTEVPVTLQLPAVTETVQVTAEASPVFTASKAGTAENIPTAMIQALPTISRSLQDIARTSPYFNQIAQDTFASALSVAGRNVRYNSIQIDGAVNNDLFSIQQSAGTPGGATETQPISFDVIEELQLVVSPYDVRQGMFSGGGINAVTRSGTNALRGTTFYVFRDQRLVGDGIDRRPIATFNDKQFGGTLGGPLVRNRVFLLGNLDWGRKRTPVGYSISGVSGVSFGHQAEAQQLVDIARARYGYAPGGFDEFIRRTRNNKVFVRADANVGRSQVTLRHNFVDGANDVGTQSNVTYQFPDNFYAINSETHSTVGQLNSTFGSSVNEFRVTYQRIRDFRTFAARFPAVTVRLPDGARLVMGTDASSHANELDQDTVEVTNDLTMLRGRHTWTVGTHNEFFKFRNLFIQNSFGAYEFASLDTFAAGIAQGFNHSFSLTSDPRFAARFKAYQLGAYVGDLWRVTPRLSLTYGVRWDRAVFPDTPTANPAAVANYGFATDVIPAPQTWSPRVGFNWNLAPDGPRQQVRGGVGVFGGRNPYVYLSNQYSNTGIEFRRLSLPFNVANQVVFSPDPDNQPKAVGNAGTNEIDVIDPDYQFPRILRGNLAYDRSLPFGLVGNVELLFTDTLQDVNYRNLNLVPTGARPDGRVVFSRRIPVFSDVILLTNTSEGNTWMLTTEVERPFRGGWFTSASYSYGRSNSVSDTTNSTARSTWINVYTAGDINNPPVAVSNFDVRHRVVVSGSYLIGVGKTRVTLSAFYSGQTGRPYSYNYSTDVNNDGATTNDLLYYPRESEVVLSNGTYQDLVNFIEAGRCSGVRPGSIVTRNSCRMPWVNTLDVRAAVALPIARFRPELTVDLLNLLNLLDRTNGQVQYAAFNDLLTVAATDVAGRYAYSLNAVARPGATTRYARDDLRSRWQAQIGLRLRF